MRGVDRRVRACGHERYDLGEGPVLIDDGRTLQFVDIVNGRLHRRDLVRGSVDSVDLGGQLGAAVPVAGGGFVVARDLTLSLLDQDFHPLRAWSVEAGPDVRFNDCRADPDGRLWAGTMSTTRTPGRGALYRVDPEGLVPVVGPTTLSNGLGWSADGETMYFIDSTTQTIARFAYDRASGTPRDRVVFAEIPPEDGLPDGLAVDAGDHVWVCLFRGGVVRRYAPDGSLAVEIELPVSCPTCPAFGPPGSGILFVTSSRHLLSAAERRSQPWAGAVLQVEVGVDGQEPRFLDPSMLGQ